VIIWTVRDQVIDPPGLSIFKAFPCMGIYGENGAPKEDVADVWMGYLP
jgi:hypothetical protein